MTWNHEGFKKDLTAATQAFDWERTRALCADLVSYLRSAAEPYPLMEARAILDALRRKRQFALLQEVADVLIQSGQDAPHVQCLYAQGLIEQKQIMGALRVLSALRKRLENGLARTESAADELGETRGLLGRAHKQAYVNATEPGAPIQEHLVRAIAHYHDWYQQRGVDALWHGINAVALICRARRDKVELKDAPDPYTLARAIAAAVREKKQPNAWDCATAMEAHVALDDAIQAQGWLAEYVRLLGDGADAFEFGSTLRQLEEVWQLDAGSEMGARLLEPLRGMLLQARGGEVTYQCSEIAGRYEGNFGAERFRDFYWLDDARDRCRHVARLATHARNGMGTGIVVRGSDLHEGFGDQLLLLTNAHVVADEGEVTSWGGNLKPALFPDEARITFEASAERDVTWTVKQVLASSPPWKLDFSLLALDHPPPVTQPVPIRSRAVRAAANERVYIVGHPLGETLKYSLYDNLVLGLAAPFLHYRTPTEKGSSGSPVFDDAWNLVALHHKGGDAMRRLDGQPGTYAANEGILIAAIREALA